MKFIHLTLLSFLGFAGIAGAANIVWVSDQLVQGSGTSDNNASPNGVFGSGTGPYPDQGFLTLLTNAGHTVTRFNPADTANVLSAADVATLNTYDLVILGKSMNSNSFDTAAEVMPWNQDITRPILCTNVFLARRSRLGWFGGTGNGESAGTFGSPLTFPNPSDPVSAYIIGATALAGNTTSNPMYETITVTANPERGQNFITTANTPPAAANLIASGSNGLAIMSLPADTVLAGQFSTGQTTRGYRLMFAAGNQETATVPENVIGNSGFENLSPENEHIFRRAVALALNNGSVPPDADDDGLIDSWETTHFGNASLTTGLSDSDGDGLNNLLEYAFGLDPNVGDLSAFGFGTLVLGLMDISISKHPYCRYTVESSTDLQVWTTTGFDVIVDDTATLHVREDASAARRLFRVRIHPMPTP